MSRGFVKESDFEEAPVIPARAALPAGTTNYVTPEGMNQLLTEKQALEAERLTVADTDEGRRQLIVLDGKLGLLQERIASARVLEPNAVDPDTVRFGKSVTYRLLNGSAKPLTIRIVGVDEANVREKKIAFVAPLARALVGRSAGEEVSFELGERNLRLEILKVE